MVLALALLVIPVAYLFGQLWVSAGNSAGTMATERAALAYARPLNNLLAALVDAQYSAARGTAIDESAIRAGINEINRVDRKFATLMQIEQRWAQLAGEIDSTISRNPRGAGALREYGAPIALTRAMLDWLADSSQVSRDPASPYHLINVALHQLPDVVASAGELAALAVTIENPAGPASAEANRLLTIAQDRVARISEDVGIALRAGTGSSTYAPDLQLLRALDEFAASADELNQATAELGVSGNSREHVDAASARVKMAAIALEAATLNAFDAQLTANAAGNTTQQRILLLAGVVIALAIGGLLWLLILSPAPSEAGPTGENTGGRHGYPDDGFDIGPYRSEHAAHLVDARELLTRESMNAGRVVGARKR